MDGNIIGWRLEEPYRTGVPKKGVTDFVGTDFVADRIPLSCDLKRGATTALLLDTGLPWPWPVQNLIVFSCEVEEAFDGYWLLVNY